MSYHFDGVNDNVFCSIGACNFTGASTVAAIVRCTDTSTSWSFIVGAYNSTSNLAGFGGLWRVQDIAPWEGEGDLFYTTSDAGPGCYGLDGNVPAGSTAGWVLLVVKKASGTVMPRWSYYDYDLAGWVHGDPYVSQTVANGAAPGASGTVRFGEYAGADDANLDLLVAGAANSVLWASDAALEAAGPGLISSIGAWDAQPWAGLWGFRDSSSIKDRKSTANETSRAGTTVVADPAGWSWGTPSLAMPPPLAA